MKRVVILALAVVFGIFAAAPQAFAGIEVKEDGVQQAQKVKRKKFFVTRAVDDFQIIGKPKVIPDNNKVIVPYFRVTFATGGRYLNSVGGITTSKSKVLSRLSGVDQEIMQNITDAMYDNLLTQLKEAGYEVLDLSALNDSKNYQSLESNYPVVKDDYAMFTPANRPFPGRIPVKAHMAAQDVDALMLQADYTVNFLIITKNEKRFTLGDKAQVAVSQGINVLGDLSVITPKGAVTFQIQQPIASEKAFGKVEDATTVGNKVSDGVALAASWLGGNGLGNRQRTKTVEVDADAEQYKMAAQDALSKANLGLTALFSENHTSEEGAE